MTGEAEPTPPAASTPPTADAPQLYGTGAAVVRPGVPAGGFPAVPPPPPESWRRPRRVEAIPGTPFGVVHLDVPPVMSGLAVGSLVAGIGSILVALAVGCLGLTGAQAGWGAWAAGAFAILGGLFGAAAVVFGLLGQRQIRRVAPPAAIRFTGRGLAIAGLSCGGAGLLLTVLAFLVGLLLQLA